MAHYDKQREEDEARKRDVPDYNPSAITKAERAEIWDRRFLELAGVVASWSKDPSTHVGSVIVRPDRTVASMGYNGFARGVDDDIIFYEDRTIKYERVIHAELNAILSAKESLDGYALYCTLYPCARCASAIIQSGITGLVTWTIQNNDHNNRIAASAHWAQSHEMFMQAGIKRKFYDREASPA